MREDDLSYLQRRATEEEALALTRDDPATAAVHRQLANAYRLRIVELGNNGLPLSVSGPT
jgi:hypothetical protein